MEWDFSKACTMDLTLHKFKLGRVLSLASVESKVEQHQLL